MMTKSQCAEIKELLEVKFQVIEQKIDQNREIVSIQYRSLQEDIIEIKGHVKETNGKVGANSHDVTVLKEQQKQDNKIRRWISLGILGLSTTVVGWILAEVFGIIGT